VTGVIRRSATASTNEIGNPQAAILAVSGEPGKPHLVRVGVGLGLFGLIKPFSDVPAVYAPRAPIIQVVGRSRGSG
jgi:hypothetical protein